MKNSMKLIAIFSTAILFMTINIAMIQKPGGPWNVPAKYKSMKSTIKAGDASINTTGKELFNKHCKSCHGAKGLGDGPKAAALKTKIVSFTDPAFKSQTDGDIYYKTNKGRDEMPAYEKKIPDANDRWAMVAYMRFLGK